MSEDGVRDGDEARDRDVVRDALLASRDPDVFAHLLERFREASRRLGRKAIFMEVCGSHTYAVSHTGIRDLTKDAVELISGPGCPVCVTSQGEIERMVGLARKDSLIIVTYGDMIRVPSRAGSLERVRAEGQRVEVAYSAMDALHIAEENPGSQVVFLGVGFETTTPASAVAIKEASRLGISNFSLYSAHKLMPSAMRSVLSSPDFAVDGLLLPGHVATITGYEYFAFTEKEYHVPAVVAGFEACDVMYALARLLEKVQSGDSAVENCYPRAVSRRGNAAAQRLVHEVFCEGTGSWRGLGEIPMSALFLSSKYEIYDASARFELPALLDAPEPPGCGCAKVLVGRMKPNDCPLFGKVCNPKSPVGPCMVSSEGSCRTHYMFGGIRCE